MMFTRRDLNNKKCTKSEYYSQFVNDRVKNALICAIGLPAIKHSVDISFNDISDCKWDTVLMVMSSLLDTDAMAKHQDFISTHGMMCIMKEAAIQLRDKNLVDTRSVPRHNVNTNDGDTDGQREEG
jgi:hypothetical protein